MQQFQYLSNITASASHDCIDSSQDINYYNAYKAFKTALEIIDAVIVPMDEVGEEGIRGGKPRKLREANEFVVVPDAAISLISPYMYRHIHKSDIISSDSNLPSDLTSIINLESIKKATLENSFMNKNNSVIVIDDVFTIEALEAYRKVNMYL